MNTEKIKNYFTEKEKLDSIGHAYLFSNTNYENIVNVIEYILCSLIFKNNIKLDDNPDIYFVESEKNVIKKEKILELEEKISKTSQIGNSKVYIIKECEKLNAAAANCLLKTLEEPGENVYAFLITENIDLVISTIKSRCQVIQCEINNKILDEELINKSISIINILENIGIKSIVYNSNELYKTYEKEELKKILEAIELFYKDCLNKLYDIDIQAFKYNEELLINVLKINNNKKIIRKIKVINDNINLLKYNLNGSLFIDKLIIEFGRLL